MSLKIWLPLVNDVNNQGLASSVNNYSLNTFTSNSNGKIGKCYSGLGIYHLSEDILDNTWSLALWIKATAWGAYNDILLCKNNSESTSCQFYMSVINGKTFNIGINGGSSIGQYSYTFSTNTWYHLAATYDGSIYRLYLNGNEVKSASTTAAKINGLLNIGIGCRSTNVGGTTQTGYTATKYYNDVRIYDNCLSPKEIKELSKGLVLHYPLNRGGFGCDNLVPCGGTYTKSSPWTTTLSRTDGYALIPNSAFEAKPSTTYTISVECDGKLSNAHSAGGIPVSEKPCAFWIYLCNVDTTKNWQGGAYDTPVILTSANHNYRKIGNRHVWTYTLSATQKYISLRTNTYSDGTTNITVNWWNIKIEEGSTATPWIPNSSSGLYSKMGLDEDIVYDVSGLNNNGEWYSYDTNGSVMYDSDTPKYNVSTHISSDNVTTNTASGTVYLYGHCYLKNPDRMTVAFWCKPIRGYGGGTTQGQFCTTTVAFGNANAGYDYQSSAMNHRDGTIDINDSASATQCRPSISFTANEWHHYAITYDGQTGRVYKDGVETSSKSFSSPTVLDSFIGVIIGFSKAGGVWRSNDSYYSDFRVYATALTESQIKELYNG